MKQFPLNIQLHTIRRIAEAPTATFPLIERASRVYKLNNHFIERTFVIHFVAVLQTLNTPAIFNSTLPHVIESDLDLYTNTRFVCTIGKHHFAQTRRIYNYDPKDSIVVM